MEIRGLARILGDEVSTELMLPIPVLLLPLAAQAEHLLEGAALGGARISGDDDILLAGSGFGVGSARPAARVLLAAGVAAVVARSISQTFIRGAVNYGLPCFEYALGETSLPTTNGGPVIIDVTMGVVRNADTGEARRLSRLPATLETAMLGGGTLARLVAEGHVRPL